MDEDEEESEEEEDSPKPKEKKQVSVVLKCCRALLMVHNCNWKGFQKPAVISGVLFFRLVCILHLLKMIV